MVTGVEPNTTPIPLARPSLAEAEIHACERVLRSGRLVLGPENQRFEAMLAQMCGRGHALAVTSGTTALELALWALAAGQDPPSATPLGRADGPREVLVPAAGFPAAANAVLRLGGKPVAVDVDEGSWTMDTELAAGAVTPATWGLVSVDLFGLVAEVAPLLALAEEAGLVLVDDAACSLGGFDSRGHAGGGYGAASTLSFHPRKVVTTGEGGAVLCDDDQVAARLVQLRNQGQSRPGHFARAGTNARLGEAAAAIGQVQLGRLAAMLSERRLLVSGYQQRLSALRDAGRLRWQTAPDQARPAHQTFAVILAPGIDRDRVRQRLAAGGIESGLASYSLNRLAAYAHIPALAERRFPVAEALHERGLALPLFVGMRSAELDRVCEALKEALS